MGALRTRRPTGVPSWPLILLAGEAKTGKTFTACEFTGDERVGRSFMLDLGEGSADEYGAVPGADFEIIDHDGTWIDIVDQVEQVRDLARAELIAGRNPVCLIADSMTAEWAMLSAWTDARARRSKNNRALLRADPDAEIDISSNYWNDANSRHNRLMNIFKTFPGIVIMTALETEKTQFGPNGRPVENAPKVARPDGQKRLTADASVWLRLSHDHGPTIVGMRSLRHNIRPGVDTPEAWPDFTIGRLVFDYMGLGPGAAQVRNTPVLNADQVAPGEEVDPPAAPSRPQPGGKQQSPRPMTATERAGMEKWVRFALASDTVELAAERDTEHIQKHRGREHDVLDLLDEDVRERLGITPDRTSLTYAELGPLVVYYVDKHKRSPLAPLDAEPAADDHDAADEADNPDPDERPEAEVRAEEDAADGAGREGEVPVPGHVA